MSKKNREKIHATEMIGSAKAIMKLCVERAVSMKIIKKEMRDWLKDYNDKEIVY